MKKRRLMLGIATLMLVGGITFLLFRPAPTFDPGPTRENFRRLAVGMTEAEVEAILGPGEPYPISLQGHYQKGWRRGEFFILANFRQDQDGGRLKAAAIYRPVDEDHDDILDSVPPRSIAERLRRLLPW
jgi:hypothetical protein